VTVSGAVSRAITLAYVGLLILLSCLPVITVFAALRAGTVVVTDREQTDTGSRFWSALRSHLAVCTRLQLVWMAAVGLALFDIGLALVATSPLRPAVAVAGACVLVTAVALVPYLVLSSGPTHSLRDVLRAAVVRAGRRPAITLALTALTVVVAGMGTALPLGIPLYLSGWAAICVLVVERGDAAAVRRIRPAAGELA
jgi:uncharacterized membrane protein YesL